MIIKKGEQTYTLRVAGRDYTLTSTDSPEHVRRVAVYVDRKIAETGSSGFVNRETAAVIAGLVSTRVLLIMTSTEGIYADPKDPATLVRDVLAKDAEQLEMKVRELQEHCVGASRAGANGARAKLEFALRPALRGTTVIIGHGRHRISDLVEGCVPCTRIGIE